MDQIERHSEPVTIHGGESKNLDDIGLEDIEPRTEQQW